MEQPSTLKSLSLLASRAFKFHVENDLLSPLFSFFDNGERTGTYVPTLHDRPSIVHRRLRRNLNPSEAELRHHCRRHSMNWKDS